MRRAHGLVISDYEQADEPPSVDVSFSGARAPAAAPAAEPVVTANIVLSLRDVTVRTGGRDLVRGLDLDLAGGEVVAVRGPSGGGKTSLLRTIAGLQDAPAGTITLRGQDTETLGWPAFRRQVVLVSQKPVIFPGSVEANLARPFAYRSALGAHLDREAARRLLDRLRLDNVAADALAAKLSVGQQQRVHLARAVLVTPTVFLLDEPDSALDPASAAAVHSVVREACAGGSAAALVATHTRADDADAWWDRMLDLDAFVRETP